MRLAKTIQGKPFMVEALKRNQFKIIADKDYIVKGRILKNHGAIKLYKPLNLYGNLVVGIVLTSNEQSSMLREINRTEIMQLQSTLALAD